jgi:hypothetical protein
MGCPASMNPVHRRASVNQSVTWPDKCGKLRFFRLTEILQATTLARANVRGDILET